MQQKPCNLCPRKCNALRTAEGNVGGFCGMPVNPVVARADLHFGEEPCISGKNGSGTVFFSGCNLKCVFCQNYDISTDKYGEPISIARLAEIFYELELKGAHNINLVNPSHYVSAISSALKIYHPKIPIVYNSSSYDLESNITDKLFDVFLLDLKYVSELKSFKYSGVNDYFAVASQVIKKAYSLVERPVIDEQGIMQKGLIVRHLILPLATNEAIKTIDWFCENTPNAFFSLMSQYTPCGNSNLYPEINRKITRREYNKVCDYLLNKNLTNAYFQELSSASNKFIPEFNGYGVKKP